MGHDPSIRKNRSMDGREHAALQDQGVSADVRGPVDAVVQVDPRGVIVTLRSARLIEGPEQWVGKPFSELFRTSARLMLEKLRSMGWVGVADRVWPLTDGCLVMVAPHEGPGLVTMVLHDVTGLEAVRYEGVREAQSQALAGLAGSVAAELATSVNVVEGRLELALDLFPDMEPALRRQLEIALAHTREVSGNTRALRLVGHQALTTAASALHEVMDAAWDSAAPRMKGAERDGAISSSLIVGAEALPLSRALTHLLVVLADMKHRTIRIRAKADLDGVTIELVRGSTPRSASQLPIESRGFAFSVARGLIEGLGGSVLGAFYGDAVTITIRLPLPSKTRARARRGSDPIVVVGRRDLSDVLLPVLDPEGYKLHWVESADLALKRIEQGGVVGVITELVLPACSGLALARYLVRTAGPPVVVLSHEPIACLPSGITVLAPPLARRPLLRALGRRVRG